MARDGQGQHSLDPVGTELDKIEKLAAKFFGGLLIVAFFYALALALRASGLLSFAATLIYLFGVLVGVTACALVIGGLFGFIFGIPKMLQHARDGQSGIKSGQSLAPNGQQTSPASGFLGSNTSLEEISDWLTKITVGVSLVEARELVAAFFSLASWFRVSAMPRSEGAEVVFAVLAIGGLIAGFLLFYLETRTRLALLLGEAERKNRQLSAANISQSSDSPVLAAFDASSSSGRTNSPASATARAAPNGILSWAVEVPSSDSKILQVPYSALNTAEEFDAWASAQARAGNWYPAIQAMQDAVKKWPDNQRLLIRLADILIGSGSPHEALPVIAAAKQKTPDDLNLLKRELLVSLYLPAPKSFEDATAVSDRILSLPGGANDPWVYLWRAAAAGQEYSRYKDRPEAQGRLPEIRMRAFDAASKVVELAPAQDAPVRWFLRQIMDPKREGSDPSENDLQVFKEDSKFYNLVFGSDK